MSEHGETPRDTARVERIGDAMVAITPCCGRRVLFPLDKAVAEATLKVICPGDGVGWLLELVADKGASSGLRAVWAPPSALDEETGW